MSFKQDRLENEKNEPLEASSLKFINVPVVLISLFIGFGVTYLGLRTKDTSLTPGDSRTAVSGTPVAQEGAPATGSDDLAAVMEKGKQIFTTTCQACHQAGGQGIPGAFPPLAGSEWVNGPASRVAAIVLHGINGEITVKGQKFQGAMPAFKDQLKPEEIAAVATYVRNSFGNKSDRLSVDLVEAVKKKTEGHAGSWGGEAELNAQDWK
jgi:mono/diheme cytochrome c family protein